MSIEYHRTMLADRVRNEAFYQALQRLIEPGRTTVADIGSGTGLLGFMASRLGAKEVHCYEQGEIIEVSRQLARRNRIRNCHFYHDHSSNILEPPKVDLVISETLGNFAYEENILETLNDARRFLKPKGVVIPGRIEQFIAPVITDRIHSELTSWDTVGFGLDFAPAKGVGLNNMYVRTLAPAELAADLPAQRIDVADLNKRNGSVRHGDAEWDLPRPLQIYGFALWWQSELVPGVVLSTAPDAPRTHWEQLYLPLLEPIAGVAGDRLAIHLISDTRLEVGVTVRWSVTHSHGGESQTQRLDLRKGFI